MNSNFDTIVIGGGPAGMIAAGRAAELGKKVLLLEKNPSLGNKLLISGGGRCNITNMSTDLRKNYQKAGKYLGATFAQFDLENTLDFFHKYGVVTKVENEGRVFPMSNSSETVLEGLKKFMADGGVEIRCSSKVTSIESENGKVKISLSNNQILTTNHCVVATGGVSHPETGSTGDGFNWLRELGHNIIQVKSSLVPLKIREDWVKRLSGFTLQDIKLTVFCDDKKQFFKPGKLLFTHFGISGPTILNMSKKIGDLLHTGIVTVAIDLHPGTDHQALRVKLNELLTTDSNRMIKNLIGKMVPNSLVDIILYNSQTPPETYAHSVTRESRIKLVDQMKGLKMTVEALMGNDKAIVSSGGVDINEVDFKTMQSKVVPGLYLVGDMLDIDRPSGGYSLQLCWTTGYVAGEGR